jgi:hypothetical protein
LAGFSVVLFRAHYLHASHVHPMVVAKLTRLKMENLIATTFEIYHQALVWLAFLWITTVVIFIYTLGGGSLTLGLIAFLLSFAATYLYEKDLEIELEVEKLLAKGT